FGRLAAAVLDGRWWLDEAPTWLNELLSCGGGRFCVVYPPLPAIMALPLVPFLPTASAQVIASRVAGGASGGILYYALRGYGAPTLVGALLGISALARLPVAVAAPALALLTARRSGTPYRAALVRVVAGGLPFALLYVGYSVLRWGTPFDSGYARLTEGDFFFQQGLFSPIYLVRQLYAIFLEPPDFVEGTPFFLRPRFVGMSLFL